MVGEHAPIGVPLDRAVNLGLCDRLSDLSRVASCEQDQHGVGEKETRKHMASYMSGLVRLLWVLSD